VTRAAGGAATEPPLPLAGEGRGGGRSAAIALTLLAAINLCACGGRASNDPALASQAPRRRAEPAPAERDAPSRPTTTETSGDESAAQSSAASQSASGQWWDAYADRPGLDSFEGRVSYYADSLAGRSTASGEPYDPSARTAASRTLAFGTVLRVTRVDTGASVIVRVNDRGPFGDRRRVLDLSRSAAEAIDMIRRGVVEVRVEVIERP